MLWDHAEHVSGPFEIADVVPAVAVKVGVSEDEARALINELLGEAARLPDGQSFFCVEGYAVVPQSEFFDACLKSVSPDTAYPFEI